MASNWALRAPWRTGRKVRRTIYAVVADQPSDDDPLIGVMDFPDVAAAVVEQHNAALTPQRSSPVNGNEE